ncbi:MAG: ATP-binding protein [Bacteroidales bacterium]|nr:ATP-binding protein [Bacteroidales bacterium]
MQFFDRKEQLESLAMMRRRSYENHSMLTIVTGRRRIGKTTLIDRSMGAEPYVYLFVGKKDESVLCREYSSEIRGKLGMFIPEGITSFGDLFALLVQESRSRKFTLVIDEFQNFSDVNPSIFSDIQNHWDKGRLAGNMNFIVSGSVYSLMTKLFKDKKEPLYGRDDLTIKLQPFAPSVLHQIMKIYCPEYTADDILALYTFTGAIPKYIELLVDAGSLTREKMIDFITRADSPFIEEGRKLLVNEFGKKYGTYFSIMQAISEGYNTQAEIKDYLGKNSVGGHLAKLEETYNLIDKKRPIWSKKSTQNVKFEISDVFLRFWFRYIEKNQQLIEINQYPLLAGIIRGDYETYSGEVLERFFKAEMMESLHYRAIDSWWDPKGYIDEKGNHQQAEIDIVAIDVEDKKARIFEVKRNPDKYRKTLLEKKVAFMKSKEKRLKKYRVEISCLSLDDILL